MPRKVDRTRRKKPRDRNRILKLVIAGFALIAAIIVGLVLFGSSRSSLKHDTNDVVTEVRARKIDYEVVNSYPHDPTSFTQGLLWHDGGLYESTGQYGQSKLRRLEFPSGRVLKEVQLSRELFGE